MDQHRSPAVRPSPYSQLRAEAEALVKEAVWLRRRAEMMLANISAGRLYNVPVDALAGREEVTRLGCRLSVVQASAERAIEADA